MTLSFVKRANILLNLLNNFQDTLISVAMKSAKIMLYIYLNIFFQDDLEEDAVEVSCFIFLTDKHKNQLVLKWLFPWSNAEISST